MPAAVKSPTASPGFTLEAARESAAPAGCNAADPRPPMASNTQSHATDGAALSATRSAALPARPTAPMRCPPNRSASEPKNGCGSEVLTAKMLTRSASSDGASSNRIARSGRSAGSMLVRASFAKWAPATRLAPRGCEFRFSMVFPTLGLRPSAGETQPWARHYRGDLGFLPNHLALRRFVVRGFVAAAVEAAVV